METELSPLSKAPRESLTKPTRKTRALLDFDTQSLVTRFYRSFTQLQVPSRSAQPQPEGSVDQSGCCVNEGYPAGQRLTDLGFLLVQVIFERFAKVAFGHALIIHVEVGLASKGDGRGGEGKEREHKIALEMLAV
ncbi:MAG: hypothetical protein FRX49_04930 [Trebouxia sp. A1-2]|nr:MAG: hypothetical protein FRX49_04930 [Trebouxia sp. A1-2]